MFWLLMALACSTPELDEGAPAAVGVARAAEPPARAERRARKGGKARGGRAANPTTTVENPLSKATLAVYVETPPGAGPFPALVVVPGGIQSGQETLRPPDRLRFLKAGFALVIYDPDGRGQSGGTEDLGGRVHQAALKAVVDLATSGKLAGVDPARVGLLSMSYGVTAATGMLATYGARGLKFYIDWEGPADRTYSAGCGRDLDYGPAHNIPWGDCDDDKFWNQREAVRFIGKVPIPYQRVQRAKDHAQPDLSHALELVEAAEKGKVPWVRLNDDPPGKPYTSLAQIRGLPNTEEVSAYNVKYARELMEQTTGQPVEPAELPDRPPRR